MYICICAIVNCAWFAFHMWLPPPQPMASSCPCWFRAMRLLPWSWGCLSPTGQAGTCRHLCFPGSQPTVSNLHPPTFYFLNSFDTFWSHFETRSTASNVWGCLGPTHPSCNGREVARATDHLQAVILKVAVTNDPYALHCNGDAHVLERHWRERRPNTGAAPRSPSPELLIWCPKAAGSDLGPRNASVTNETKWPQRYPTSKPYSLRMFKIQQVCSEHIEHSILFVSIYFPLSPSPSQRFS